MLLLITKDNLKDLRQKAAVMGSIKTSHPVFIIKNHMDGSKEAVYHLSLIHILDRVFLKDNLRYLSIEQERFMEKFFEEAGIVTNLLNEGLIGEDLYKDMDEVMYQLDNFLGSYFGVEYVKPVR